MFGPTYTAGCPVCSSAADTFNGPVPHLNARNVTFTCISRALLDKLQAYKRRMGRSFPWASSYRTDYNFDLEISHPQEATREFLAGGVPAVAARLAQECGTVPAAYPSESPVMSACALEDGTVYLTYSTTARGLEFMMGYYGFLDRAPLGRDEGTPAPNVDTPPRRVPRRERDKSIAGVLVTTPRRTTTQITRSGAAPAARRWIVDGVQIGGYRMERQTQCVTLGIRARSLTPSLRIRQ
jgi:hypothetical protein